MSGPAAPGASQPTVGLWLDAAARRLADGGLERARAEARSLLALALDCEAASLFARPEAPLDAAAAKAADAALARRLAGEPLGRIAGRREFWSLDFMLGPEVLEPRADTETLVEAALARVDPKTPARLLDLGVGSGCILLSILSERPLAEGVGIDRSKGAAAVARANAAALGVGDRATFAVGDWGGALASGAFDLVVANPPYIARADRTLQPDAATLGFDPPLALWGGDDGLDAYRAILPDLPRLLAPGGAALFEIGAGQADDVAALADRSGFRIREKRRDLAGRIRCLGLERAEP